LLAEAREEFAKGSDLFEMDQYVAQEKYSVLQLRIKQFEQSDGSTYEVLFAYTSAPRGFGAGFYYTPSGNLPPWVPIYGVVCSKQVDRFWYAFNTVDSQIPPDPNDCPEDVQYR
jgi:hypothetical protein